MENLVKYLRQLELSEIESKLYLTLLQSGAVSVKDLAAACNIKRTTAYIYIEQLVKKGLTHKLVKGSKKLIAANPPESLQHLVEQKISHAKSAEHDFSEIVKLLNAKMPTIRDVNQAEIRYYTGKIGVKKIYEEALSGSEFRLYAHMAELGRLLFSTELHLDFDMFENALAKNKNLRIYEIISDTPDSVEEFKLEDTKHTGRYQYKFMPGHVGLTSPGILLYDDKVAIIPMNEKLTCIVLYNKEYYINSVKLFDFIWNTLPEPIKKL